MEPEPYDRSGQWLIEHHGDSILWLADVGRLESCRALKGEVVLPKRVPDGLLEARRQGETEPDLYLVEIFTYPKAAALRKMTENLALVLAARRILPEGVAIFLSPGGRRSVGPHHRVFSRRGGSRLECSWQSVNLWTLSAQALLDANDVGLTPWITLARFDGPPEPMLEECRRRIDRQALPEERANLLAVSQVLMRLKYNDPGLFNIFGGSDIMIESPLIQELVQEAVARSHHKGILRLLERRFGTVPQQLIGQLRSVTGEERLVELTAEAGACPTLEAFGAFLTP